MPTTQRRTIPRTWLEITSEKDLTGIFDEYGDILAAIDATTEDAFERMLETQERAVSNYTADYIEQLVHNNFVVHQKKYAELAAYYAKALNAFDPYDLTETYGSERTPDLTSSSSSVGTGSSLEERRQSKTTTHTPGVTTTEDHSVNPYDNTGLRVESQNQTSQTGYTTTAETYAGSPDRVTSSSSAASTVKQSGTDTLESTRQTTGRNGRRFSMREIVDDGLYALNRVDILDIIIQDIADDIFLQMWL